jgi:hypothetical protein
MTAPAGAVRTDQAAAALLSEDDDLPESDFDPLSPLLLSDEELLLSELPAEEDSLFSLASRARRLVP